MTTGDQTRGTWVTWVVLSLAVAGCFKPVDGVDAPCPCAVGFECCPTSNVCRAPGACGDSGVAPGDDGGSGLGVPFELRPLPARSETNPGATGLLLRHAMAPAHLATVGHTIYLTARQAPGCADVTARGNMTLSRFEADGGTLTWAWTVALPSNVETLAGLAANASGIVVTGDVAGALPGEVNHGQPDSFVARFDPSGRQVWARQLGSLEWDQSMGIDIYPDGASVTVVRQGQQDVLVKLDADGGRSWSRDLAPSLQGPVRWGDGVLRVGRDEVSVWDAQGTLQWSSDAGVRWSDAVDIATSGASAQVHGLRPTGADQVELVQEQWQADGGVEPAVSLGSWPAPGAWVTASAVGHGEDAEWFVAGVPAAGRIITVTRQSASGTRTATDRWLFEGPDLGEPATSCPYATPLELRATGGAPAVMLGDVVWNECGTFGPRWLWLMPL